MSNRQGKAKQLFVVCVFGTLLLPLECYYHVHLIVVSYTGIVVVTRRKQPALLGVPKHVLSISALSPYPPFLLLSLSHSCLPPLLSSFSTFPFFFSLPLSHRGITTQGTIHHTPTVHSQHDTGSHAGRLTTSHHATTFPYHHHTLPIKPVMHTELYVMPASLLLVAVNIKRM